MSALITLFNNQLNSKPFAYLEASFKSASKPKKLPVMSFLKPRSIIHLKSFWFGVFALGIVAGGWVRSMTLSAGYYWQTSSGYVFFVGQKNGSIYLSKELGNRKGGHAGTWYHWHSPNSKWFPQAFELKKNQNGPGTWFVAISYFSSFLIVATSWTVFIVWRWRLMRFIKP